MRGSLPTYRIRLKKKQRKRLEGVVRRRTPSHWLVQRAQIIVLSAKVIGVNEVAQRLSITDQKVRRWRKRFTESGVDGLKDRPRRGKQPRISEKVWRKVAVVVVQPPKKFGVPCARWTLSELHSFLRRRYGWTVSRSHLGQFLRKMALRPHRIKYWLNPKDPEFDRKAARICRIYLQPPKGTTVLSLDEKPGVQLLSRKCKDRPMRSGRCKRIEFEYKRHGTRNIFCAFNVRNGHAFVQVTRNRKFPAVAEFIARICGRYRRGPILIITDNINTRRGRNARTLRRMFPRIRFAYTPFHGSWLNQVEIWFGILTSKCLRQASFNDGRQFAHAVYAFARYWNNDIGHPFAWTATGRILHA